MNATVFVLLSLLAQSPQPVSPEAKGRAQALLREGNALFAQGEAQAALEKFEAAYAVFPSPKLQFNIAQANRDLGRPVEALAAYERFLASAPEASPETREDARRAVADLEGKLGRLKIDCWTKDAEIALDGKPLAAERAANPVWTTAGRHQVTVRHAGDLPAIEDVDVAAGQLRTVTVALRSANDVARPVPQAVAPTPSAAAEASPTLLERRPAAPPSERRGLRARAWLGAGATAAFAVGAVIAGSLATARYDSLNASCGKTRCSEDQIDSVKLRAHVADVLWGLAGAAAVATGVVVYLDNREGSASMALAF
jgi:tetratricopeptide (TPR) repeat protein